MSLLKLKLELAKTAFKKVIEKGAAEKNLSKEEKEYLDKVKQEELVNKLNFFNLNILKFFSYSRTIRKLFISSLFLDLLIFLIPRESLSFIPLRPLIIVNVYSMYILAIIASIIILAPKLNRSIKKKSTLSTGVISLIGICLVIIIAAFFQVKELTENNDWHNLAIQLVFVFAALSPILKAAKKAMNNKNRPDIGNIIAIASFLVPITIIRFLNFTYSFSLHLIEKPIYLWAIYTIASALLILSLKPVYTVKSEGIRINHLVF